MSSPEADLLKVAPNASLEELKRVYRKAALVHHPDQNPAPEAAHHFRRITEAYRFLAERAEKHAPPRSPQAVAPDQRLEFVLLDVRALLRRWSIDQWSRVVDGLPAAVWVAGALEAFTEAWPGEEWEAVLPSPDGVSRALEGLELRLSRPRPSFTRAQARKLAAVVDAAEARIRALQAPTRKGRRSEA